MFLRKVVKSYQHVADEKKLPHNTSTGRTSPMFCTVAQWYSVQPHHSGGSNNAVSGKTHGRCDMSDEHYELLKSWLRAVSSIVASRHLWHTVQSKLT